MKLLPIVPGCMALVIGAYSNRNVIGMQVKVIRPAFKGDTTLGGKPYMPQNVPAWLVESPNIVSVAGYRGAAFFAEKHLMRIDGGDFSHERETEKVREKA